MLVCKGPLDKHAPLPKVDVEVVVRHASDISGHLHGYEVARDMICCVSRGDEEEGRIVFVLARVESFAPRQYWCIRAKQARTQVERVARAGDHCTRARPVWETDISSGRPTSHLGDRHLDLETDISSHTSRWCASRSTSDGYRRLENARVERNKFVTRGAAAHVALVDCFR